ncbi:MAG TPA: GH1 family beta-glucosidase [Candidatus Krumholzibacteria bacterium]|nr:GH1 family beta-glucosidase [Candidatus Krumholzibacteria bacterium]
MRSNERGVPSPPEAQNQPPPGDRTLFPADFLFGAATSAYQVEGSPLADGAGASNWHLFAHTPGRMQDGATGDVACDHYRRALDDVALMHELGLQAYRFSIAWARVLPEGHGRVNRAGLDFYARLVDALLAVGIQPCITLYHWDLPAALDDRGGWLNRDVAGWFGDYAHIVFRALGDRVPLWATLNEPWVVADAGYLHGVHAPGHSSLEEVPHVSHNLLRAHGSAVQAFRSDGRGQIGLVVNLEPKVPASERAEDLAATQRADAYMNRQYLDAVFFGHYPEELHQMFGSAWPEFPARDFTLIGTPIDFLGINYYTRNVVRHDPQAGLLQARSERQRGSVYTELDWEVHPESLTRTLCWVKERYGDLRLYVTENGAAFADPPVDASGVVKDPLRVDYFRTHLRSARAAMQRGVDLRGYFAWSLLDNLEWASGFSKRFGLVHVDFDTQVRTPKASAHFYREVIRSRGAVLDE